MPASAGFRRRGAWPRRGAVAVFLVLLALVATVLPVPGAFSENIAGRPAPASWQLWERVLREHTPQSNLRSLFWVAVAYANLGRIEESRQAFEELEQADPQRSIAEAIGNDSRAVLRQNAQDLRALNGLAFLAYAEGNYREAARHFETVVALDPQNPWPRSYLGFSLGKDGQLDEGVRVLEEGVRLFPENEILHFLLGLGYYQKGSILRALIEMAKAPRAIRYFR